MQIPQHTFALSAAFLAKLQRFTWLICAAFITIPLVTGVYFSIQVPEYSEITIIIITLFIIFIAAVFFLVSSATIREYRAMRLVLEEGGIRRVFRRQETFLAWKDIQKIRIDYDKNMQPTGVWLWTTQKTPAVFAGFDQLDVLIAHVQGRTAASVETKTHQIDFTSPIGFGFLIGFSLAVIGFISFVGGRNGVAYLGIAMNVFLAYGLFFGRMLSRVNADFSTTEKIAGLLYFVIAIIKIASLLK